MDQNALQVTPKDGGVRPVSGTRSARRLARQAWFVRAVAITFLGGGAFISYLFFSTV